MGLVLKTQPLSPPECHGPTMLLVKLQQVCSVPRCLGCVWLGQGEALPLPPVPSSKAGNHLDSPWNLVSAGRYSQPTLPQFDHSPQSQSSSWAALLHWGVLTDFLGGWDRAGHPKSSALNCVLSSFQIMNETVLDTLPADQRGMGTGTRMGVMK